MYATHSQGVVNLLLTYTSCVCPATGCAKAGAPPSAHCTNITVGFLRSIEDAMAAYAGPRFHLLGNHDVDILNQSSVFANIHDSDAAGMNVQVGGQGYSSQ